MTKILLVEDHEEVHEYLNSQLTARGYEISSAVDGQEAMAIAGVGKYDLILLDLDLPIQDGWTVARRLRDSSVATPIIAITAHAMSGDRARAIEAGCNEYHSKPIDLERLVEQIDDVLLKAEC